MHLDDFSSRTCQEGMGANGLLPIAFGMLGVKPAAPALSREAA